MSQVTINNNVSIPMPVALVGATIDGKANFMTVGWVTRVNYQPPMLAVAIGNQHYTPTGIRQNERFSVCFPDVAQVQITDYCGIVSGRKVDKSGLFKLFYGESKTAPMIAEFPLNMECKLVESIALPSNTLYIGEIVNAYSDERYLTDGKLDYRKIDPLLLTMPDNTYWRFGEKVGDAWKDGLAIKTELEEK